MNKKKIELKSLQVKSFITNDSDFNKNTVKGGGFLSLWGDSCNRCPTDNACTYTCGQTNCTCQCETQFQCPTDDPCLSTDPADTVCVCM